MLPTVAVVVMAGWFSPGVWVSERGYLTLPTVAVVLMAGWFSPGVSENGVTSCSLQLLLC